MNALLRSLGRVVGAGSVLGAAVIAVLAVFTLPSCTQNGYCFDNCEGKKPITTTDSGPMTEGDSGPFFHPDSGGGKCVGFGCTKPGDAMAPCTQTNAGVEICDGLDNNCNGQIDEPGDGTNGVDYSDPLHCGNCATNCLASLTRVVMPTCTPPTSNLGIAAGICGFSGGCAPDYYDIDGNAANGCEYYCPWNPTGANTQDLGGATGCGRDDDCDGKIDEDVDTCSDVQNCGQCGFECVLPHATPGCSSTGTAPACDRSNTHCTVQKCDAGYVDADGSPDNGCEYQCTPTNGGVEICDGLDNDCNHQIDDADPGLVASDPRVGATCFGGDKGLCSDASHQGVAKCIDASIQCCDSDSNNVMSPNPNFAVTGLANGVCRGNVAPFVLTPGQTAETCNGIDDDCDGVVDDNPIDAGGICGSVIGSCSTGTYRCVAGVLACIGGTQPNPEICDGNDNDCDGVIDGTKSSATTPCTADADCAADAPNVICLPLSSDPANRGCVKPPMDIADGNGLPLVCDAPPPPPAGVPQPCRAGTMACFGGVPVCQGAITPQLGTDRCNEDTNCDGQLTNQTGLTNNDPQNCGACGNVCNAKSPNANYQCNNGVCAPSGCLPGFIECGGSNPNDCETQCTFTSSTEVCDGIDNNCNCKIDEAPITPPSVVQACGISASATDPGCTSAKVKLACVGGGWQCTFTDSRYCSTGDCSTTADVCDGLDNNCDGQIDEGFKPPALLVGFLGQACFSDDGAPAPGDGPCRTQGAFVCKSDGSGTTCSAKKDLTKATTEICDGIDNDCNGIIDDNGAPGDSRVGKQCFGGTKGICAAPANAGATACLAGGIVCAGTNLVHPGDRSETCNNLDDDCNGTVDDNLTDTGAVCGSSVGQCKSGAMQCAAGKLSCAGSTGPQPEICDGLDNNCNGQIDDSPTDVGTACNVPPPPPTGVPQPCKAGVFACVGGGKVCQGSVTPNQPTDNCGEDTNCDGKLTNQTGLKNSDVLNCGACGNNCNTIDANGTWACQSGVCVRTGCKSGFIDCDANPNTCERACTFRSSTESCNGVDDNCDCLVDNNVPPATAVQVCGVSPSATDVGCTGAGTACVSGAWKCTFPAGYCAGGNCSTAPDACDGLDNNCNGVADEGFKPPLLTQNYLGQACTTPATDGPCQGTGSYVCNGAGTATQCNATKDTSKSSAEICDGIDNNCNGQVDEAAAVSANDSRVGKQCFGGTQGACAASGHAGTTTCVGGTVQCQGANLLSPGQSPEICNGIDDDCNGVVDDNPTDVGGPCGSGVGACQQGKFACVAGAKQCQGSVAGKAETCNGIDDDCDGTIDNHLTDTGGDCDVPPSAPAATAQCPVVNEPCKKGTLTCAPGGVLQCSGAVTASSSTPDSCCQDTNCDGQLTGQPNFLTDVKNCGGCGNDCTTKGGHVVWGCSAGACVPSGCAVGFIDCDANPNTCERACTFGGAELCNGVDDDCNCKIDDNITSVPTPTQVCGVNSAAQSVDPLCGAGNGTNGILVSCSAGAWQCTFPTGYCNQGTPPACSTTQDNCDTKDNNCNGVIDDNFNKPILTTGYINQPCASDDGKPPPGDGQCRTTGVFTCNGTTATKCNATKDPSKAGAELCDGTDNDCDGSVDEPFNAKGTNTTFFVKPAVVKVSANLWVYQYEASRPSANTTSPGSGDGYWCTSCTNSVPNAPSGVTLDKTPACSVQGKVPWFNVTPAEVEETCQAMGGSVCTTANFTTACQAGASCEWGYGTNCSANPATLTAGDGTVYYDTTKSPYCNLGPFDFDNTAGAPNSDGLLPTNSARLAGCFANVGAGIFDLTGNLREISKRAANDYPLMGGSFQTQSEDGAQCTFTFDSVPTTFKYFDTGFRCCFSADPTQ